MLLANQSRWLPGWSRHRDLYEAFRDLDGDHAELLAELLEFHSARAAPSTTGAITAIRRSAGRLGLTILRATRRKCSGEIAPLGCSTLSPCLDHLTMRCGEAERYAAACN